MHGTKFSTGVFSVKDRRGNASSVDGDVSGSWGISRVTVGKWGIVFIPDGMSVIFANSLGMARNVLNRIFSDNPGIVDISDSSKLTQYENYFRNLQREINSNPDHFGVIKTESSIWDFSESEIDSSKKFRDMKFTFAKIHDAVISALVAKGWKFSGPLKVRWLEAPGSDSFNVFRLWFKAQAIYYGMGKNIGTAHSLTAHDIREMSLAEIIALIEYRKKQESGEVVTPLNFDNVFDKFEGIMLSHGWKRDIYHMQNGTTKRMCVSPSGKTRAVGFNGKIAIGVTTSKPEVVNGKVDFPDARYRIYNLASSQYTGIDGVADEILKLSKERDSQYTESIW